MLINVNCFTTACERLLLILPLLPSLFFSYIFLNFLLSLFPLLFSVGCGRSVGNESAPRIPVLTRNFHFPFLFFFGIPLLSFILHDTWITALYFITIHHTTSKQIYMIHGLLLCITIHHTTSKQPNVKTNLASTLIATINSQICQTKTKTRLMVIWK